MHIKHLPTPRLAIALLALTAALACDGDDSTQTITRAAAPAEEPPAPGAGGSPESADTATGPTMSLPPLSCGGLLGGSTCDPVTAWPCDLGAGETCEFSNLAGAFRCSTFPTRVPFCGSCDRETQFCGPGTTCGDVFCERYCCQDSDCERGPCVLDIYGERGIEAAGFCPEDSAAVCGSTVGAQLAAAAARSADAGGAPSP